MKLHGCYKTSSNKVILQAVCFLSIFKTIIGLCGKKSGFLKNNKTVICDWYLCSLTAIRPLHLTP